MYLLFADKDRVLLADRSHKKHRTPNIPHIWMMFIFMCTSPSPRTAMCSIELSMRVARVCGNRESSHRHASEHTAVSHFTQHSRYVWAISVSLTAIGDTFFGTRALTQRKPLARQTMRACLWAWEWIVSCVIVVAWPKPTTVSAKKTTLHCIILMEDTVPRWHTVHLRWRCLFTLVFLSVIIFTFFDQHERQNGYPEEEMDKCHNGNWQNYTTDCWKWSHIERPWAQSVIVCVRVYAAARLRWLDGMNRR